MNYQHPERLRRLADDYVLGTMPPRSRRRLERLAADAAVIRRAIREAEERLLPMADALPPLDPDPRVWAAIERRVQPATAPAAAARTGWWHSLAFWRGGAMVAMGLFLASGLMQLAPTWFGPGPTPPGMGGLAQSYVGFLSQGAEPPAFLVSSERYLPEIHVKVLRPPTVPPGRVLVLWALPEGGEPKALGVVPATGKGRLALTAPAETLFKNVPNLAISLEAAGAPTPARPSGDFAYRGPCVKLW